jgi:hypothetical protein
MKTLLLLCCLAGPAAAQKADTVPLSQFQRQQLLDLKQQADEIAKQQQIILRTIIAAKHDPVQLEGWSIQIQENSILLIPPAHVEPKKDSTVVKPKKP